MLGILIDAAVLVALIKAVNAQDVDFLTAIIIAVVASVGTGLVAVGLGALMGVAGLVLLLLLRFSEVRAVRDWVRNRGWRRRKEAGAGEVAGGEIEC